MTTEDALRRGAEAVQGELEDVFWGAVAHAITHRTTPEPLSLDEAVQEETFQRAVLPTLRRAWRRTLVAYALEHHFSIDAPDGDEP